MGIALLAGQRSITRKIATEIMGNRERRARIPMLIIDILMFVYCY